MIMVQLCLRSLRSLARRLQEEAWSSSALAIAVAHMQEMPMRRLPAVTWLIMQQITLIAAPV